MIKKPSSSSTGDHQALQCLAALFPTTCWVSGRPITAADQGLAPDIRAQLRANLLWPYCRRCGGTLGPFAAGGSCQHCPQRQLGLDCLIRVGPFHEPLSRLIHSLKFARHWALAPILAPWMAEALRQTDTGPVEQLVPVPLHWFRQWWRGFNQSFELGAELGRLLNVPCAELLRRKRATGAQTAMASVTARANNVRGAFELRRGVNVAGLHLWLVDDVCTTGATLRAAASALRNVPASMRPASINAIVLAVADSTAIPAAVATI